MLAERITRRNIEHFFQAFEHKDFASMAKLFADDCVVEFHPGLPMAGEWQGLDQLRVFFETVFAYNRRFSLTLHRVYVRRPWSWRGDCSIVIEWEAEEERADGHVMRSPIVSVAETHHWKTVRMRDYFFDVPTVAEHYRDVALPRRVHRTQPA